jgi:endonuclease/exonuclease/phosphatase (EEP) superfamily protein YafD
LRKVWVFTGSIFLAGLAAGAVIVLLRLRSWPFELFHHFALHYFLLSGLLVAVFTIVRAKLAAASSVALFLLFGVQLWGTYNGTEWNHYFKTLLAEVSQEGLSAITLITHNIQDDNPHHQALEVWLASQPADVVVLQEVPSSIEKWYKEKSIYPYQLQVYDPALNHPKFPEDKATVILSKYPFESNSNFKPFRESRPVTFARLSIPGVENPWIVAIDAREPKTAALLEQRDRLLLGAASKIGELDGPVVVAGDFNATPFTPVFDDFLRLANILPSQSYISTFPAGVGWLGIPIDHILVRDAQVTDVIALSVTGSDHRPLKATLLLANNLSK